MSTQLSKGIYVEEELGQRWDKCISDTLIKFGGGLVLGGTFSLIFFKRRSWPVLMGGGFGIGMGYSNCEKSLNTLLKSQ